MSPRPVQVVKPPEWAALGVEVQAVGAGLPPGEVRTITEVLGATLVLDDDTRWRLDDLQQVGQPAGRGGLVGATGVRVLKPRAEVEALRARALGQAVANHARRWAVTGGPDAAGDLRHVIVQLAPYIGLQLAKEGAPS